MFLEIKTNVKFDVLYRFQKLFESKKKIIEAIILSYIMILLFTVVETKMK